MSKERVLDIGIGYGGQYIEKSTAHDELRIGIDIGNEQMEYSFGRITKLPRKFPDPRKEYPQVLFVGASAERLPFAENVFSRIEIVLPDPQLSVPGLEKDHFALNEEYRKEYARTHPDGWYSEFHRVLRPRGEIIIFGDIWVDPVQIQKTSKRFFTMEQVKQLTIEELKSLGTRTVPTVVNNISSAPYIEKIGKNAKDLLVKINLKSNKTA